MKNLVESLLLKSLIELLYRGPAEHGLKLLILSQYSITISFEVSSLHIYPYVV